MKEKIFAEVVKNGKVLKRQQIGVAVFDEGRVSNRKFGELSRSAMKAFQAKKGQYIRMVTESGKTPAYPTYGTFVRFV